MDSNQHMSRNSVDTQLKLEWDRAADKLMIDPYRPYRYVKCIRYIYNQISPDAKILEVGCGEGTGLTYLNQQNFHNIIGVDVSIKRLQNAKSKISNGAELVNVSTRHSLPFKDETFDIVISAAVIEHTLDPYLWLKDISRVTKPGGKIIISSDCFTWRILQILSIYRSIQPIDRAMFPTKLFHYFKQCNLQIIHYEGFSFPGKRFLLLRSIPVAVIKLIFDEKNIKKVKEKFFFCCYQENYKISDTEIMNSYGSLDFSNLIRLERINKHFCLIEYLKIIFSDENVFESMKLK